MTIPVSQDATIWDGITLSDVGYQSDTTVISARWHGFFDEESYIKEYLVSVGTTPGESDIIHDMSAGVYTKIKVNRTLSHGIE